MDLTPYWESDGERRREQQLQLGGPPVGERCICTYVAAPAAVHVPMVVFSFVPRQSRHGGCVWRRHGRGQHRARESRGGEGAAQRKALPPWQPEGPRSPPLRMGGGDPKVFRLTVFESRGVSSTELAESFPTVCLAPPNSQRRSVPSVQWGLLPTPTLARAGPGERGGVVIQVTVMAHMMPLLVSLLREQPQARPLSTTGPGRTLPLRCAGPHCAGAQHQVESRKVAEGRVEEENKIRGGSGRPGRGAICVAKDAKSAH